MFDDETSDREEGVLTGELRVTVDVSASRAGAEGPFDGFGVEVEAGADRTADAVGVCFDLTEFNLVVSADVVEVADRAGDWVCVLKDDPGDGLVAMGLKRLGVDVELVAT